MTTVREEFLLLPDRLVHRTRTLFGSTTETPFAVSRIDPDVVAVVGWDTRLKPALTMLATGIGFAVLIHWQRLSGLPWWVPALAVLVGVAGLLLAGVSFRRTEYVWFRDVQRPDTYLFSIPRDRGGASAAFDEFVAAVRAAARDRGATDTPRNPTA